MNHSGEGLLIYRRGKKLLTDFETLRSCLQVELHGDESLERLPLALNSVEENEHRRSKSATIADNLSGKRTETSERKCRFVSVYFSIPCFSRDHFIYLKWFLFFLKKENTDGDTCPST